MPTRAILSAAAALAILFCSCGGHDSADNQGHHTPIDSTNLNGTAPVTYGADNPANDQDTTYRNATDTGTKISTGPDNNQQGH